ncbi:clathrin adaptor complex small chain-domain-containing protein [Suillus lakei]|nr:clathrin adaptor complex small chain-domain-containing protein [Suillus lakei]
MDTWPLTAPAQPQGNTFIHCDQLQVSRQGPSPSSKPSTYHQHVRQPGKVRLAKWFSTMPPKQKAKIVKDVTQLVLARRTRMCNFPEYKGEFLNTKVVYRRYASLLFVCGIASGDNDSLITLKIVHRYVEVLDRYFGNVCCVFLVSGMKHSLNLFCLAGPMQESCKKLVLRVVTQSDGVEEQEPSEDIIGRLGAARG